jgi:phosphoribosylanthranilate isomerase
MKREHMTTKTSLKICGVTRTQDLESIVQHGVDYVGFNFYKKSPRFISPADAKLLWENISSPSSPIPCAVVVDMPLADLTKVCQIFPELAVLQFHGAESTSYLKEARTLVKSRKIWKAVKVGSQKDLDGLILFKDVADRLMVDGKNPGSGEGFDWSMLAASKLNVRDLILAGGIGVHNIAEALQLNPAMIDICTGVEERPGIKDPEKIAAIARHFC